MPDNTNVTPRSGKDLFDATTPFVNEFPTRSWWNLGSTLVVLIAMLTVAAIYQQEFSWSMGRRMFQPQIALDDVKLPA